LRASKFRVWSYFFTFSAPSYREKNALSPDTPYYGCQISKLTSKIRIFAKKRKFGANFRWIRPSCLINQKHSWFLTNATTIKTTLDNSTLRFFIFPRSLDLPSAQQKAVEPRLSTVLTCVLLSHCPTECNLATAFAPINTRLYHQKTTHTRKYVTNHRIHER